MLKKAREVQKGAVPTVPQSIDQQLEVFGMEAPHIHLQDIWFWQSLLQTLWSVAHCCTLLWHTGLKPFWREAIPQTCFRNCKPLQGAACWLSSFHTSVFRSQLAMWDSPCKKPSYSFQSRLKDMPVTLWQLQGIWKRATYPPSQGSTLMESKAWHLRFDSHIYKWGGLSHLYQLI